ALPCVAYWLVDFSMVLTCDLMSNLDSHPLGMSIGEFGVKSSRVVRVEKPFQRCKMQNGLLTPGLVSSSHSIVCVHHDSTITRNTKTTQADDKNKARSNDKGGGASISYSAAGFGASAHAKVSFSDELSNAVKTEVHKTQNTAAKSYTY
ncbi:hypothetical protein DP148_27270, partial [Salmonella enterica subsp. enterica serovar Typhimurium]